MRTKLTVLAILLLGYIPPAFAQSFIPGSDTFFPTGRPWVDIQGKGAVGDGQVVHDVVTNGSTTVTSASALFASTDCTGGSGCTGTANKTVICVGCNAGVNVKTAVATFVSTSNVTLAASTALTLPVNISCTGCSTTPYGYATVNSSGAITGGVVVSNGTSGATACTATILGTQQGQSGSGGTLTCTANTGADGHVDSLTVNAAGSGYFATLYWATDDSTPIANAFTAAGAVNGCVYVPPAQKSFYLMNTQLAWTQNNTCMFGAGKFSKSYIVGDVGNVALIKQNQTSFQEVFGLRADNVFDISAVAANRFVAVFECDACSHVDYHDLQSGAGRALVQVNSAGSNTASFIRMVHNYCNLMTDVCLNANGGTPTTPHQYFEITGNQSQNTIYTLLDGAGHDYNFEDTSDIIVASNFAVETADSTQPNESCYQTNFNHATAGGSNFTYVGNECQIKGAAIGHTVSCFEFAAANASEILTNVLVEGNECDSGSNGIAWTSILAANVIVNAQIKGNNFKNCGWSVNGCIYLSSSVAQNQDVTIEGNHVQGVGNQAGAGPGILTNNLFGIKVIGNTVTNAATYGVNVAGTQKSLISNNKIYSNGATGSFDGILCNSSTSTCSQNTFANNILYSNTRYGLNFSTNANGGNRIIGTSFPGGNTTANINDGQAQIGPNNCNMYEASIACDFQGATINSLTAQTLLAASTFNTTATARTFLVTIASECTAVASSTLQWQVNYTGLNGAINQQGTSHSCAAAGQFTDTFLIRSTGATAVTYQAVVANAPAFRDTATVELR